VSRASNGLRARITRRARERNPIVYAVLLVGALTFPTLAGFISNGDPTALISQAADAGVYVLLAIGLNVVVGFAGLLDLGYAAFFAIGAYTAGMLASGQLGASPLHHEIHIPFWIEHRPCACAAITSPSSPSGSARSCRASSATWASAARWATGPAASMASTPSTGHSCRSGSQGHG
jgi:ABC-type branched-subunit amino acid transport system permease subunit